MHFLKSEELSKTNINDFIKKTFQRKEKALFNTLILLFSILIII